MPAVLSPTNRLASFRPRGHLHIDRRISIELSAVVALVAISAWQPETHGRHIRRLVVVLLVVLFGLPRRVQPQVLTQNLVIRRGRASRIYAAGVMRAAPDPWRPR